MALVRILVDGYSLLHHWHDLAPGRPRHSNAAREELINRLTQYHDATGTPVTIVFDGDRPAPDAEATPSTPEVEVIYSRAGQTADQVIEKAAHRLSAFGEVLVVTDDFAERDTAVSVGATTSSCDNFIQTVNNTLADLERVIKSYNQKERSRFQSSGSL